MRIDKLLQRGFARDLDLTVQRAPSSQVATGGDFGGSGGSGSGSGGSGSGSGGPISPLQLAKITGQRPGAFMTSIPIKMQIAGVPQNGPPMNIGPGIYVEVKPAPGNAVTAFFSTVSDSAAKNGPHDAVATTDVPRQIDVHNLSELWVYSANLGEGIQVTLRRIVS